MKVNVPIKISKSLILKQQVLHHKDEDYPSIEIEVPDEWLMVMDVIPGITIMVVASGSSFIRKPKEKKGEV